VFETLLARSAMSPVQTFQRKVPRHLKIKLEIKSLLRHCYTDRTLPIAVREHAAYVRDIRKITIIIMRGAQKTENSYSIVAPSGGAEKK